MCVAIRPSQSSAADPAGTGVEPSEAGFAPERERERPAPEEVFAAGLRHHHLANTAYPIGHRRTIWVLRRPVADHVRLLAASLAASSELSLYVHVPFCERRCAFCEYTVLERHAPELEEAYFAALRLQLTRAVASLGLAGKLLRGLDLGGGTPSLVEPARLGEVIALALGSLRPAPGFAMSIETTPKIAALAPERLRAYRSFGIERISVGLQTVSAGLLHAYGREVQRVDHNARAVENIRAAGFRTLNIDLMYGLARQGMDDWRESLAAAVALRPEVITLYRMRYKGTRVEGEARDVSLERAVAMVEHAERQLAEAGYHAPPGKNAFVLTPGDPGTSAYLTSRVVESVPYLGLGLGAQTFTNHLLAYNHGAAGKRLEPFLRSLGAGELGLQDLYHLPRSEGMAKMISVSFYFGAVRLSSFRRRFGVELTARFPAELAFVLGRGLMELEGDELRLTPAGERCLPGVIALFYSAAVQRHLLGLEEG